MNKNKIKKVIFLLIFTAGFLTIPLKSPVYAQPIPIPDTPIPNTPIPDSVGSCECGYDENNPNELIVLKESCSEERMPHCTSFIPPVEGGIEIIACECLTYSQLPPEDGIEGKKICEQIPEDDPSRDTCEQCFKGVGKYEGRAGSWTAIGCIPTDASGFVGWLLGPLIGIAGGIAFLLILGGGFSILFSQGNPETIAAGKERITAAILGLLVIIFSVFILKVIGVDILDLPGFE